MDAKGEVLLTILSSLTQDESRSISENLTWGIRRHLEKGQHKMSTKRFMGYDTDEDGKLVINRKHADIVKRLFYEFLSGKTVDYIKRIFEFEREGVINWDDSTKWQVTTLQSMLENEKYKDDAVLQKSYTVDFVSKKRVLNQGEIQKFYIEDDHEAIIEPWIWECVQLEIERYKVKGIMGCANRHVEESTLEKRLLWPGMGFWANPFLSLVNQTAALIYMESDFMLRVLQCIKVFETGELMVVFLDGTEVECENEEV